METELSTKQRILAYVRSVPYSPTIREIMDEVGLASPSSVQLHLSTLEREGLIGRGGRERDRIYAVEQ